MASEKGPSAKLPHSKSAARSNSAPADVRSAEPVRDAWMHGKPLLFLGEGRQLWEAAGVPFEASEDPAWVGAGEADEAALEAFAAAIAAHRNFDREVLAQPI